ncbi:MAG: ABC transporter permease [Bacteroidales bacterium]|nr:ABC transporter permease [Bacteroidales bacterium]
MKNKSDILIKVLSLGVGLAVGIVLIAKVFFELSYDSFYQDVEQVYMIRTNYTQNGETGDYGQVSGAVAVGFMADVPGVEYGTRVTTVFNEDVYLDEDKNKLTASLVVADTCFFRVFDRPILVGDPVAVLGKLGSAMVSRSFAERLVGTNPGALQDVVGKQICNENLQDLPITIEGVYEDFPKNGSLDFDILLSMETYNEQSRNNWLGNDRYRGMVRLAPGVDPHGLSDAIRAMQEKYQPMDEIERMGLGLSYYLRPFSTLHTSDPQVKGQVILLSVVAVLLILISLLNYILIVVSSLVKRSREVGVRKCYGAEGKHIYGMLAKEASLHLLLSLALAATIIFAGRGVIENLLGVPFTTLLVPQSILAIALVLLVVLLISIVVPAELYQRIPVQEALKNYTEHSRKWKLGLLGIQVLINVFLVVMLLTIGRQYRLVSHSNPGYNYENLYYVSCFDGDRAAQLRVVNALRALPEVQGTAASYNLPYRGSSGDNILPITGDQEYFNVADQYECTPEFFDLLGIEFVEGRAPRDSTEFAVDERFVERIAEFEDWSDGALGKQLLITGHGNGMLTEEGRDHTPYIVSGVYRNYLIGDLQSVDTRPSVLFYGKLGSASSYMPHTLFKVEPSALPKVRAALEEALPGRDIEIVSYEEAMRSAYDGNKKMRNTLALGAVFGLLIALLGLVGFIRDESLRRSKEMAVRKINGAVTQDILALFVLDILKLGAVMAVLASIGAFFVARRWLEQFAEKVSLHPFYFILGALVVLLFVLGVVALFCLRIARANPVESLKNE